MNIVQFSSIILYILYTIIKIYISIIPLNILDESTQSEKCQKNSRTSPPPIDPSPKSEDRSGSRGIQTLLTRQEYLSIKPPLLEHESKLWPPASQSPTRLQTQSPVAETLWPSQSPSAVWALVYSQVMRALQMKQTLGGPVPISPTNAGISPQFSFESPPTTNMSGFGSARSENPSFNFDASNFNMSLNAASHLQSSGFTFGSPAPAPLLTTVEAAPGAEQLAIRPDWLTWYTLINIMN